MIDARTIDVTYDFMPVGQGLFSSGTLSLPDGSIAFRWVYDCGTDSRRALLSTSLDYLEYAARFRRQGDPPRLDLVTISHFDRDHVNGLVSLLQRFSVHTLLLPYVPLWGRLMLAFAQGIDARQRLMQFYVNPVRYLLSQDEVAVERVVMVPGERAPPGEVVEAEPVFEGDGPWEIGYQADDPKDPDQLADFHAFNASSGAPVKFLRHGSPLRVRQLWEFLPYNDAEVKLANGTRSLQAFRRAVGKVQSALLSGQPSANQVAALRELYDMRYGSSSFQRNVISLFLYAGPLGTPRSGTVSAWCHAFDLWRPLQVTRSFPSPKFSALHTGDGFLNNRQRLRALLRALGPRRARAVACMQVMHHGAENNWHAGVAKTFSPVVSVMCSDPATRHGHPHAEVLRDFWPFNPMQCDTTRGVVVSSRLRY